MLNRLKISAMGVNLGRKVRKHRAGSVATISRDPHVNLLEPPNFLSKVDSVRFPGDQGNPDFVSNSILPCGYALHLRTKLEHFLLTIGNEYHEN